MGRRSRKKRVSVPPQVLLSRHLEEATRAFRRGALSEAEDGFRKVLRLAPDLPEVHSNLGTVLVARGKHEEAVRRFRSSLERAQLPQSWKGLGDALAALGRVTESAGCYQRALSIDPGYAGAHRALARQMAKGGDKEGALAHLAKVVELQPHNLQERSNLGAALLGVGRVEEAETVLREVLEIDGNHRPALFNLGLCRRDLGNLPEAIDAFRRSIEGGPPFPEAEVALAHTHLLAGNLIEGWERYEARRRHPAFDLARRELPGVEWDGGSLEGKSILVYAEQGFGDLFQFSRLVPHLAHAAGRVLLECRPPALRLMRSLAGVDEVVATGQTPPHDFFVPLLSLPHRLGITLESLPAANIPYLMGPEEEGVSRELNDFLGRLDHGFRLGLVWAGEPSHPNDRNRSASFADLAPLLEVEGVQAVSLQFGKAAGQLEAHPAGAKVLNAAPHLKDFHDTAAVLARMDFVVSVDTAVAHLAGAMGIPTGILLPFAPEWRWMEAGDESPWYPTGRLFRQERQGVWRDPVRRLREHLVSMTSQGTPGYTRPAQ